MSSPTPTTGTARRPAASRGRQAHRWLCCLLVGALVAVACSSGGDDSGTLPFAPTSPTSDTATPKDLTESDTPIFDFVSPDFDVTGFDDHSTGAIASIAEFDALAATDGDLSVVKFVIPDLRAEHSDDPLFATRWLDGGFYELHDEWYWFRLLNGAPVAGFDAEPADFDFETIDEIYEWAEAVPDDALPLDLARLDSQRVGRERLYSSDFYEGVLLSADRSAGVGSLIRVTGDRERWLMELQYSDDADGDLIGLFFDRLTETLPPEIAESMEWVIRSPIQESTALEMAASDAPYADRIVRYSEIVPPGETRVYNPGIAAGRLRLIEPAEDGSGIDAALGAASSTDVLVLRDVPDWLPPANALLTATPQTPLAHVNLLARNRGIPNASISGLLDDPSVLQAARSRAPVVVRANADGELSIILLTTDEYTEWRGLGSLDPIAVPDPGDDIALTVDLTALERAIDDEDDVEAWRPIIGGKSAGFLALLGAAGVTTPPTPVAITVAPYQAHLAGVEQHLDAMLADPTFRGEAWARFLLLEGPEDFVEQFDPNGDFTAELDAFRKVHPPGSLIGDIVDAGGFKALFRDAPLDPETLDSLTATLEATYADLALTQGLRFRSSSTVEDIEGFNGAGLYDSNTGFLRPDLQVSDKDQTRSIEWALKKTWASYWGFEAFEERRRERVDHRSGAMGVLVHPRFDDELETNNGVATLTLVDDEATVVINVQRGDVSVTNPDPDDVELPEEIVATLEPDGRWAIDRRSESTIEGDGPVLADEDVVELAAQLLAATELWRDRVNSTLSAPTQISTVTLDFEFKTMAEGWPRTRAGDRPGGLVIKQARSLDPGLRLVPDDVLGLPVPRDVIARARLVERWICDVDGTPAEFVAVTTDPLLVPDLGFGTDPLRLGDEPAIDRFASDPSACERTVVFSSPDQFLIELVSEPGRLDLLES